MLYGTYYDKDGIKRPRAASHWSIKLRLLLLLPGSWAWNAWVRDTTAFLERKYKAP